MQKEIIKILDEEIKVMIVDKQKAYKKWLHSENTEDNIECINTHNKKNWDEKGTLTREIRNTNEK
jgi:hypothetical protein